MIVDDEPLALNKLKRHILKFPYLELAATCHSAECARRVLESNEIDIIYTEQQRRFRAFRREGLQVLANDSQPD